MKALLLVFLLSPIPTLGQSDLIQTNEQFQSSGILRIKPDPLCASLKDVFIRTENQNKALKRCDEKGPLKIETGVIDGVPYEFYYSDGSGTFGRDPSIPLRYEDVWRVGCEKDAITDEKTCHLSRGDLRIWVDNQGRSELYIGSDHHPGSNVIIRIDGARPIAISSRMFKGSFGYRASPAIIQKLTTAKSFTTRYQKWPYTDYEDETLSTPGFKEALAYIRWAVAHIK